MKTGTFFEINVTNEGRHVFATDSTIRSYGEPDVEKLLLLFNEKFPKSEGYGVSVTSWRCGGQGLSEKLQERIEARKA